MADIHDFITRTVRYPVLIWRERPSADRRPPELPFFPCSPREPTLGERLRQAIGGSVERLLIVALLLLLLMARAAIGGI